MSETPFALSPLLQPADETDCEQLVLLLPFAATYYVTYTKFLIGRAVAEEIVGGPHGVEASRRLRLGGTRGDAALRAGLGSCPRAGGEVVPHACGMEIIVEIHQGEDGRPTGTVRAPGGSDARSFSGNLEVIALAETLYRSPTTL